MTTQGLGMECEGNWDARVQGLTSMCTLSLHVQCRRMKEQLYGHRFGL